MQPTENAPSHAITQATLAPPLAVDTTAASADEGLLSALLDQTAGVSRVQRDGAAVRLHECTSWAESLRLLFGDNPQISTKDAARLLDVAASKIETAITQQVNAVLHTPQFQALEASWRGLYFLWQRAREEMEYADEYAIENDRQVRIKVRVLSVTKQELFNDAVDAVEFDQSVIFKKIYEGEFGQAGGEPFGLLVGDYEFRNHPNDLDTLASLAGVGAASFAPFIAAAAPQFFGVDDFRPFQVRLPQATDFAGPDSIKWRALRQAEDSRFLGLTLPRVLMRRPYGIDPLRGDGFRFREDSADESSVRRYLWGNAAYALASVVMRAYAQTGWFAEVRGFERGKDSGGLVTGLDVDSFGTDRQGIALKSPTDIALGVAEERSFSELGFIPLCTCPGTEYAAFFSNASAHQPATFDKAEANTNAQMSAMLQYVLCASRFAHYLKQLCRERIGSYQSASAIEAELIRWISDYVTDDPTAPASVKAKHPLRSAEIRVVEIVGRPGAFQLEMKLVPHYQLDALSASLRLVHRLEEAPQ